MCGQSSAYNINATLLPTNPLFQGFSSYPNVNKEIIFAIATSSARTKILRQGNACIPLALFFCSYAATAVNEKDSAFRMSALCVVGRQIWCLFGVCCVKICYIKR